MSRSAAQERLIRMDERMEAVHEYIVNEIRPSLKELIAMKETIRWMKAGVMGVYGIFGSMLLALVAYVYLR